MEEAQHRLRRCAIQDQTINLLELKNLGVRRLVDDLQLCKDDKPGPGTSDVAAVEVLRGLGPLLELEHPDPRPVRVEILDPRREEEEARVPVPARFGVVEITGRSRFTKSGVVVIRSPRRGKP